MKIRPLAVLVVLICCATLLVNCGKEQTTTTQTEPSTTSTSSSTTSHTTTSTTTSTSTTSPAPDLPCSHTGNINPPTCEDGAECSECGEMLEALDHFYVLPGVHTEGSCKTHGYITYSCLRCDAFYSETDDYFEPHTYKNGVCSICDKTEGKVLVAGTMADVTILPDKYNTGAGGIGYEDQTIVKVTEAGYYNGYLIVIDAGGHYRISLAGLDPVNDKIVISNLDFSNATFVGVANYSGTDKPTIYFENCIFKGVSTDRDSDKNKVHLYFDHCTLKSFYGSTATMNWCEFGGNDDTDGLNPFQDVTVTNCYVGNKDAVGYEKELHADATQIYGYGPNGKEIIAKNQYYFNFRAEMPSVRYTDSLSYTNSILMISLDYNDADNITFEHCIVNGGGCPIMIFDNPKNKNPGFKMTNILYKDIYYGVVHEYTPTIIGLSPASDVTLENILQTQTLLVGSVWKENGQTHFSVTNDTNEVRQFTVMTDKGTYTFEVNACPLFADLELNQAFSEFPFDVKYSIPEDATWAVCYDSTGGTYQQIRFYNPEGQTVYLDEGRLESWSAATEIYEIDHGRIGENLRWVLTSDGTLTLSVTDKKATTNTPMEGFTAYKNLIRFVKVTPGVTQITASLFFNCVSLESVSLPSTLQSIGTSAFRNCQNLKTINIPYGVTSIGTNAFENCVSLERIVVPSTVTSVGKYVFRGCQSLTEAVFAAKVRSLSSNLFMNCHNLKSLWLTDSIKNLSTNALTNCYALDTLYYAGTAESLASTVGGTLLTKADITYITEQDYAAREDRSLVQREPKKPTVTFSIANKTYDGEPISYSFTTNSDGQVTYKWMRSSVIIDGAPTEVGRYYLVLKIAGTENYQAYVAHYSFFITEQTGIVTITSPTLDKAYDGLPVKNPTFTTNSTATPTVTWRCGDAVCASVPTLPGVYMVTVSVPATENYTAASASMQVTISDTNGVCWDGTVASAFAGGNGTEQSPYLIATSDQLAYLAFLVNNASTYEAYASAHYRLVADLFLNVGASSYASWESAAPAYSWKSIGLDSASAFKGTFDGNGYTIYGLYATHDGSSNSCCGLFGYLKGAVVENLKIQSSAAVSKGSTSTYAGILTAMAEDTTFRNIDISDAVLFAYFQGAAITGGVRCTNDHVVFENCTVDVSVSGSRQLGLYVGRVLNSYKGKGLRFTNCVAKGSLSASYNIAAFVGDLISNMPVSMKNCVNYATITATGGNAAGFITSPVSSNESGTIYLTNCQNLGDIFVTGGEAGGFFATLSMNGACLYIENCANYGAITVTSVTNYAGGIIGMLNGDPSDASAIILRNVVCAGEVQAAPAYFGAVIGATASLHSPLLLENVYYPVGAAAISVGKLNGATSVNLTSPLLVDWLNAKSVQNDAYLLWEMGENGPKLISSLRLDNDSLDRFADGTPLHDPLYTVLAGDGRVTIVWYKDGVALTEAPSSAGEYVVVVSIEATPAFASSSVRLAVSLALQGAPTLRIHDPSKVYDGTAVADPAIYTTNVDASVTYTYYKGVYGEGTLLAGAPTDAGLYYVVVSVGATEEYGAIQSYKVFEISPAKGQIVFEPITDREYNGTPAALADYTYNGTTAVSVTYYKGTYMNRIEQLAGAPTEIGRYVVILSAAPESNFSGAQSYCEFEILPISTSVTLNVSLSKEYDGTLVSAPAYTTTQSGGEVTVVWKDAAGNVLAGAPSAIGNYSVTVTLAANGNYAGSSVTEHFEIWQNTVWSGGMSSSFAGGCGTESDPFLIATPEQLAYLSYLINKAERYSISGQVAVAGNDYTYSTAYYRLVADLQMNANSADYKTWATFQPGTASFVFNAPANNFTPIGKNATYRFKGVFDGNGHTISGLYVSAGGDMGLFGQIEGATVKNLTIKNSVFAATNKSNGAGAIAGVVYEGTFENCKIENVSVLNKGNAGGVAGTINKDTVYRNIIFSGEIVSSENHAGGIVGQGNYGANVLAIDVSVSGSVYAKNNAAGFVGIMNTNPRLVFADCQNDATVTSVSGIAAGIIGSCFYTTGGNALIEMKNVTNRGAVTGATYAGGIIGSTTSNSKTGYVTLHNILNSGAVKTTGADASAVGAGGIFGHVHARMFVKMDNCVSLGTVEGVNAGSVIGLFALAEDNSVAQNVYGLGQTVGSAPELVVEQGKFLQLTDEQANGTDASVLNALNGAVTDENGYKTWSLADGKLAF